MSNNFDKLLEIKGDSIVIYTSGASRFAVCPDLGGRVFVDVAGQCPHRMDFASISAPSSEFNNYGGGNFWPAPEGGMFGFNYVGDTWRVQEAVNIQSFDLISQTGETALMAKKSEFVNRAGTIFTSKVQRAFRLCEPDFDIISLKPKAVAAYETVDEFELLDKITTDQALVASWTLEQFAASETTTAFCIVDDPENAINFDFYDLPGERIQCHPKGFTYKTDGGKAGQIGVKVSSKPCKIGFWDTANHMLCIRENLNVGPGVYFNIADNDQPEGPYSAADCYSIFNSDPDMGAFELETIGSASIMGDILLGSKLVSRTSFAIFNDDKPINDFLKANLGL